MDFLEFPRFPEHLVQHITRSLCFLTEVVQVTSGCEQRNAAWSQPLRRYELSAIGQTSADLQTLAAFFQATKGRWLPFRFKDPLDFNSAQAGQAIRATDQAVGRGDGLQCAFQLIKTTHVGDLVSVRRIQKPLLDSVIVAVSGEETTQVEVDTERGVVTFLEPPPPEALITAGFAFDVPCRFDSDQLTIGLQPPEIGSWNLALVEVRLPLSPLTSFAASA